MGNEALDKLSAIVLGKQAAWPETIRIGGSLQKFQCLRNSGAQLRIGVRPIKDNQAGFEQAEGSIGRQSSVQAIRHFIQKAKIRIVRRVGYDVQGLRKRKEISPTANGYIGFRRQLFYAWWPDPSGSIHLGFID
jgi:hypothetical protein